MRTCGVTVFQAGIIASVQALRLEQTWIVGGNQAGCGKGAESREHIGRARRGQITAVLEASTQAATCPQSRTLPTCPEWRLDLCSGRARLPGPKAWQHIPDAAAHVGLCSEMQWCDRLGMVSTDCSILPNLPSPPQDALRGTDLRPDSHQRLPSLPWREGPGPPRPRDTPSHSVSPAELGSWAMSQDFWILSPFLSYTHTHKNPPPPPATKKLNSGLLTSDNGGVHK